MFPPFFSVRHSDPSVLVARPFGQKQQQRNGQSLFGFVLLWTGIILTILDALRLTKLAFHLEDLWGGRVGVLIPGNTLETDPFVLLAHHRHTFWPLDPIRQLSNVIQPEGFPAHPHRGFQTVTYIMRVSGG